MKNLEGLYFHILEDSELKRGLIPRFKPLMFGISSYLNSILDSSRGYIFLSLLQDGEGYKFHFGYAVELEVLLNGKAMTAKHRHKNSLELIPSSEGGVKESFSFRGNTILSADDYEEHFALEITYIPQYAPNLILDLTNVTKGLMQVVELKKISLSKYPWKPEIKTLKL